MSLAFSLKSVVLKNPAPDLSSRLLTASKLLPWAPAPIDSANALSYVRSEVPEDGSEVVEWMHHAAAANAVLDAYSEEYGRAGSKVLTSSGDGYIPGVRVEDVYVLSERGSVVGGRGYAVVRTPRGDFRVPVGGKASYANADVLAWAAIPWCGSVQFTISLIKWVELITAPIKDRVRFPSVSGLVAPNYVYIASKIPTPIKVLKVGITSGRDQKVVYTARGEKGSYHIKYWSKEVSTPKGSSETVLTVTGFPFVKPFTLEIQPEDGSEAVLDYVEVYPP